jgi:hypothetical protein
VIGEGRESTGGVVSGGGLTVTVKLPLAVFPAESWAEQLTVVVPTGNVEPEEGEHDGVTGPSTSSFAVAV